MSHYLIISSLWEHDPPSLFSLLNSFSKADFFTKNLCIAESFTYCRAKKSKIFFEEKIQFTCLQLSILSFIIFLKSSFLRLDRKIVFPCKYC